MSKNKHHVQLQSLPIDVLHHILAALLQGDVLRITTDFPLDVADALTSLRSIATSCRKLLSVTLQFLHVHRLPEALHPHHLNNIVASRCTTCSVTVPTTLPFFLRLQAPNTTFVDLTRLPTTACSHTITRTVHHLIEIAPRLRRFCLQNVDGCGRGYVSGGEDVNSSVDANSRPFSLVDARHLTSLHIINPFHTFLLFAETVMPHHLRHLQLHNISPHLKPMLNTTFRNLAQCLHGLSNVSVTFNTDESTTPIWFSFGLPTSSAKPPLSTSNTGTTTPVLMCTAPPWRPRSSPSPSVPPQSISTVADVASRLFSCDGTLHIHIQTRTTHLCTTCNIASYTAADGTESDWTHFISGRVASVRNERGIIRAAAGAAKPLSTTGIRNSSGSSNSSDDTFSHHSSKQLQFKFRMHGFTARGVPIQQPSPSSDDGVTTNIFDGVSVTRANFAQMVNPRHYLPGVSEWGDVRVIDATCITSENGDGLEGVEEDGPPDTLGLTELTRCTAHTARRSLTTVVIARAFGCWFNSLGVRLLGVLFRGATKLQTICLGTDVVTSATISGQLDMLFDAVAPVKEVHITAAARHRSPSQDFDDFDELVCDGDGGGTDDEDDMRSNGDIVKQRYGGDEAVDYNGELKYKWEVVHDTFWNVFPMALEIISEKCIRLRAVVLHVGDGSLVSQPPFKNCFQLKAALLSLRKKHVGVDVQSIDSLLNPWEMGVSSDWIHRHHNHQQQHQQRRHHHHHYHHHHVTRKKRMAAEVHGDGETGMDVDGHGSKRRAVDGNLDSRLEKLNFHNNC